MNDRTAQADQDERVDAIEQAFETHWRHFGLYPGASLHEEDGLLWFESPIRYLPYNWVIRTRIHPGSDAEDVIARVAARFRERDVPFMWLHRPSDRPADLGQRLAPHGLDLAETATGMDLDLDDRVAAPNARVADIVEVGDDDDLLQEYEELIRTYWSVPEAERSLIRTMNRHWTGERTPGVRFVARIDGKPVGKLFLNTVELPARVGVYGVAVRPEARGHGVAKALMDEALSRARSLGAQRCVLHSSTMALPMYTKMGFTPRCTLLAYATGPLFGTHHH